MWMTLPHESPPSRTTPTTAKAAPHHRLRDGAHALLEYLRPYGEHPEGKDENFTGDDVLEGITAVVSVKLQEIQFEGQTKSKLGSVEAQGAVATAFGEALGHFSKRIG